MSILGQKLTREYVYDFAADGGTAGAISLSSKNNKASLPSNAIVTSVFAKVITDIAGTSSTVSWGNTTDPDGYSGTAIAEASLTAGVVNNGWDNGAALIFDDTNDHAIYYNVGTTANNKDFSITIGTADLTAGKMVFVVEFYVPAVDQ